MRNKVNGTNLEGDRQARGKGGKEKRRGAVVYCLNSDYDRTEGKRRGGKAQEKEERKGRGEAPSSIAFLLARRKLIGNGT